MNYSYIDEQANLDSLCKNLRLEKIIALDTEFIGENSYIPQLCLIQIATDKEIFIVDPLDLDLGSFLEILKNKDIIKLMHSSVQDVDVFYKNHHFIPVNVFDTQVAASFLGYGESISYAKMVKEICGELINKSSKLTNWQQRPLDKKQLDYAASDVKYLHQIYYKLSEKLDSKEYLEYVKEELNEIHKEQNYKIDINEIWKKLNSSGDRSEFISYLKPLARFREELAIKANKPRKRILKDEIIISIAKAKPKNISDIKNDRIMARQLPEKYHEGIAEVCANVSYEENLTIKQRNRSPRKDLLCTILKLALKSVEIKYKIAAKNIATSKDIENFVYDYEARFAHGWRKEIFGDMAKDLLNGKIKIVVADGEAIFDKN